MNLTEAAQEIGSQHGHWCASAFPDADRPETHLVCECGMPWTTGEGCLFVQGAAAAVQATTERVLSLADEWDGG